MQNIIKHLHKSEGARRQMARNRDLNRTRERIMAAAQKEFAASGFAGARTDAIACRAREAGVAR